MKRGELLERPWFHFLCAIALLAPADLRMLRPDFLPVHDTLEIYYAFHLAYNSFFLHGSLPRWLPLGSSGGLPFDYMRLQLSPSDYLVIALGRLLRLRNTLAAFYGSVLLEQAALLASTYLLSLRLCAKPAARFFALLCAAATVFWPVQLTNLRVYALVPLLLYLLERFFAERKAYWLWSAAFAVPLLVVATTPYYLPIYALIFAVAAAARLPSWSGTAWERELELASPLSLALLAGLGATAWLFGRFMTHVWDYSAVYPVGRDPKSLSVTLRSFLTYAGPGPERLLQLLYAVPNDFEITSYVGWTALALAAVSLRRVRESPAARSLWALALILALFSCGASTPVAPALYYVWPLMKYFRHLHFVLPIVKLLLILLAGMGLDCVLDEDPARAQAAGTAFLRAGGVLIAGVLLLDALLRGGQPYATHFPGQGRLPYFDFHWLAAGILAATLLGLARLRSSRARAWLIVGAAAAELGAYQIALNAVTPCHIFPLDAGLFQVHEYPYSDTRIMSRPPSPESQLVRRGSTWALMDGFLGFDVCRETMRQDGITLGLDRLVRARLGLPLDDPSVPLPAGAVDLPFHAAPIPPASDRSLLRALGCGWPKARLVGKTLVAKDLAEEARLVREARDLESVAIVRRGEDGVGEDRFDDVGGEGGLGSVQAEQFDANRVVFRASARRASWLVYSDAYHPGWRADVDGRSAPVVEVDLGLKGVRLGPGEHRVELVYGGPNETAGRWLALFAGAGFLLALGGCAALIRRELRLA